MDDDRATLQGLQARRRERAGGGSHLRERRMEEGMMDCNKNSKLYMVVDGEEG